MSAENGFAPPEKEKGKVEEGIFKKRARICRTFDFTKKIVGKPISVVDGMLLLLVSLERVYGKLLHSAPKIRVLSLFPFKKKSECSKKALGGLVETERRGFWVHGNGEKNQKVTAVATLACNWASKRASKKGTHAKKLFWGTPTQKGHAAS